MKELSTSSLPKVCPPPLKKSGLADACPGAEAGAGPALQIKPSMNKLQDPNNSTYSAALRNKSLTIFPPGIDPPGLSGFCTEIPLRYISAPRVYQPQVPQNNAPSFTTCKPTLTFSIFTLVVVIVVIVIASAHSSRHGRWPAGREIL